MTATGNEKISSYFLSFVNPNYSRSGTLLNSNSKYLNKEYVKVSSNWRLLIVELLKIRKSMEAPSIVVVMSPAQKIAPLARMLLDHKIVLDAGWPLTDGIVSRGLTITKIPKLIGSYFVDLISFHSANLILVESQAQLMRVSRRFAIPKSRLRVSFTGLNESAFTKRTKPCDEFILQKKNISESAKRINVIFRGSVNNESGINTILSAAKKLGNEINLLIVADRSRLPKELPANCFVFSYVSETEMEEIYEISDVALGQISENNRLKFTIPHKAFEAGFFAKAYVTPLVGGISELYSSSAVHILENVSAVGLIEALRELYDPKVRARFESQISKEYSDKASQNILSSNFEQEVAAITNYKFL